MPVARQTPMSSTEQAEKNNKQVVVGTELRLMWQHSGGPNKKYRNNSNTNEIPCCVLYVMIM